MQKISVLIPVYNSEKTICDLCKTIIRVLGLRSDFEIVLVNDGSADSSWQVCQELCDEYPGIVNYFELSRNFGEHNALMAGLAQVTGDYCIMMDDDFQNSPEDICTLIKEISKGYDVVYTYSSGRQDPLFRRWGSKLNDIAAKIVLRKPPGLYLSSFKIVNRFIIDEIIKYDGQNPYIDGIILRSTDRIGSVSVSHNARQNGSSGYTLSKLISLWASMVLSFSLIPLRIIGVLGLFISSGALIYFVDRLYFDDPIGALTDYQYLIAIIVMLFGLMFLCFALLAEYVGRIYLSVNKQPQYILRKDTKSVVMRKCKPEAAPAAEPVIRIVPPEPTQ